MVGETEVEQKISKVVTFVNGDIREKKRLVHYERSCGKCVTKEVARANVYAALVEGAVVPSQTVTVPSKARIGTTLQCASQLLPGR